MPDDIELFLTSITLVIVYLILSAKTEMFTKLPWKRLPNDDRALGNISPEKPKL